MGVTFLGPAHKISSTLVQHETPLTVEHVDVQNTVVCRLGSLTFTLPWQGLNRPLGFAGLSTGGENDWWHLPSATH